MGVWGGVGGFCFWGGGGGRGVGGGWGGVRHVVLWACVVGMIGSDVGEVRVVMGVATSMWGGGQGGVLACLMGLIISDVEVVMGVATSARGGALVSVRGLIISDVVVVAGVATSVWGWVDKVGCWRA